MVDKSDETPDPVKPAKRGKAALARAAADPTTARATLADLAYDHPALRPAIAQNPSTYEGLLVWLRELDDPEVNAALEARSPAEAPSTGNLIGPIPVAAAQDPVEDTVEKTVKKPVEKPVATPVADPIDEPAECAACGAVLRPNAKACGTCGTFVDGRPRRLEPVESGSAGSQRLLYVGIAAASVVLLTVVGILIAQGSQSANASFTSQRSGVTSQPSTDGSGATGQTSTTDGSGATGSTDTSPVTTTPGEAYDFSSVSGNIVCQMTPSGVTCNQRLIHYTPPGQACQGDVTGMTIGVNASGATWPCIAARPRPGVKLPYDHTINMWGFSCRVDYKTGVRCVNSDGDGFTMEYNAGVETF